MKVLVACEESQRVCTAFRERGHEAYSCDVIECSGGHPEWHIKENCLSIIGGGTKFSTCDKQEHEIDGLWDLIIAHPPCTYLTVSGNSWFSEERWNAHARSRYMGRLDAIKFFMEFVQCRAKRVAIENPVGIMSSVYRKPDQIIQPYEYGHPYTKKTCMWLRNLPLLKPTDILEKTETGWENQCFTNGKYSGFGGDFGKIAWNDPESAKIRSKTFPGIAKAMAEQWGDRE